MLREIIIPKENQYLLHIPGEYLNRKIEILVLPFDSENEPEYTSKDFHLTTFKCGGKLRDFERSDAYREQL
jgi:hypothetical protein